MGLRYSKGRCPRTRRWPLSDEDIDATLRLAETQLLAGKYRDARTTLLASLDRNKDWAKGYSCIAEKRAIETIEHGEPKTAFMQYGDTIRIEMKGRDGQSIFGAIEQTVVPPRA